METIAIKALQLILSLSILVIIHECGHFLFAKLFKVRVEKFYLFFNPWFSLFKFKPKNSETEYGVGWLPLGGYVKISGMIDESMDKEAMKQPVKPYEFRAKPAWQRLLIMVGGVLMNFVLAFFIYSIIVLHWGEAYIPTENVTMGFAYNEVFQDAGFQTGDIPLTADGVALGKKDAHRLMIDIMGAKEITVARNGQDVTLLLPADFANKNLSKKEFLKPRFPFVVNGVTNGSPAAIAGLQAGDSIVGVNEQGNMSMEEIAASLLYNKEKPITLEVYRRGEPSCDLTLTPNEFGKIGVLLRPIQDIYTPVIKHYNFFTAFPAGIRMGWEIITSYVGQLKYVFSKEGAQSLGGFGAIGNLFPDQWNWFGFWNLTALLSIMLGVMNILPIPALDGGHILFLLVEVVSGRKPSDKFLERAQMVGMVLLISLLIYANGMDIFRAFFK